MRREQGEQKMSYAAFDLSGRTAIVTGAGRGLGRGMAEALAEAGAIVVCAGRTSAGIEETATTIRAAGGRAEAFLFDAVKREDCGRLVADTATRHGRLDIMVVNHGIGLAAPAVDIGDHDWNETIAVNLTGAFLCAQAAGRQMIAQGKGGSIILISSNASLVGFHSLTAYGASKGGLDQLCRQLCVEWGPHNIRVNAVNPGYTTNNMAGGDERHAAVGLNEEIRRMTPLGRRGSVAEIASPVVFLASDAAAFVSGVCLPVDGGYCAY
jgi:NAD(P)-dependent dehydrogenase (short-subunit alcohol dehydrogenase family)